MIGKLKGIIDGYGEDYLILDVSGVGYVVHCSPRTLQNLNGRDELVTLIIETQVREDSIRLFGFDSDKERDWFRLLQSVQGVGAKVALALLSIHSTSDLSSAIAFGDKTAIARAPGIGPKLAARIVSELKDKVPHTDQIDTGFEKLASQTQTTNLPSTMHDAISALVNLGYSRPQCTAAIVASIKKLGESAETSALIRQGLKELAS
ncbi:Holliday junction ATP-dependent DNA helicase RuvA [Methylocystaceae bacterium]|nr:Holliday junction ATP-dependent DNA helicase RuvA [Methylocystaceae bacterium]